MSQLIVTGVQLLPSDSGGDRPRSFCRSFLTRSRSRQPQRSQLTRIALDWMIEGTSIEPIIDQVSRAVHPRVLARTLRSGYVRRRLRLSELAPQGIPEASAGWWLRCPLSPSLVGWNPAYPPPSYEKLRVEPAKSFPLYRSPPARTRSGYATRMLDGNILTGTEHRVTELRLDSFGGPAGHVAGNLRADQWPGSRLDSGESCALSAGTGAYPDQVPIEVWTTLDHGSCFCVRTFLVDRRANASFLVRWHSSTMPFKPIKPLRSVGRCDTGEIEP